MFVAFALPLQPQEVARPRVLAVNVIDRNGSQVSGRAAANFRGEFRGQPVQILSAAWIRLPAASPSWWRPGLEFPQAESWTRRLPEATGGLVVRDESLEEVRSFGPLIAEVYRLEVALPQEIDKPREWKLEVVDAGGRKRKDVRVAYPRLLVPKEQK